VAVFAAPEVSLSAAGVAAGIASRFRQAKAIKRHSRAKSCSSRNPEKPQPRIVQIRNQPAGMLKADLSVHSFAAALRFASLPRKFLLLTACRTESFAGRQAPKSKAIGKGHKVRR
jgi:hypothetical protein